MATKVKRPISLLFAFIVLIALISPVQAQAGSSSATAGSTQQRLHQYASDTWQSFVALTYPSGLPSDNIAEDGTRAQYTSPTNIGAYIWSTIAARDLGIISAEEAQQRIATTLDTLSHMEHDLGSGMYYNWYNPQTGEKLTIWPPNGAPVYPFLSTVDNGWLATALIIVTHAIPALKDAAQAILDPMNFGFFIDPNNGLLYGGYWPGPTPDCNVNGYTCFDFGTLNTEPRISSYIGIAKGQVPATHYFKMWRTFPPTCDWSWQETQPQGVTRTYLGVDVFEGHYTYYDMDLVPSWGGSMFEALMVPLFVPEAEWGPQSWGINHPIYVRSQILHGLSETHYGYWGFSPATNPSGGYREYGVDAIGMNPDGYTSNNDRTTVDYGFDQCPGRTGTNIPPASAYTNGVVAPHASFLALDYAHSQAINNLEKLRKNFDIYGQWGFWDSVNIDTGQVSYYVLSLDQGMVMAALSNDLAGHNLRRYFSQGMIEAAIKPLLEMEEFTAGEDSQTSNPLQLEGLQALTLPEMSIIK